MSAGADSAAPAPPPAPRPRPRAFLDFDLDGAREAHANAAMFVHANSLKYGLSTPVLSALGGGELKRLRELYAQDYEWSTRGPMRAFPQRACRVVVELFNDVCPRTADNFIALCEGSERPSQSGVPLRYEGSRVHRVVKDMIVQGGDFVFGNGSGGESIYGKSFKDERGGLRLRHDRPGVLSMGNSGKNSNSVRRGRRVLALRAREPAAHIPAAAQSQFFVTLSACPKLDGKHVVFGRVVSGFDDVVRAIEATGQPDSTPAVDVRIVACGRFLEGMPRQGHHAYLPATDRHIFVPETRVVVTVPNATVGERFRSELDIGALVARRVPRMARWGGH